MIFRKLKLRHKDLGVSHAQGAVLQGWLNRLTRQVSQTQPDKSFFISTSENSSLGLRSIQAVVMANRKGIICKSSVSSGVITTIELPLSSERNSLEKAFFYLLETLNSTTVQLETTSPPIGQLISLSHCNFVATSFFASESLRWRNSGKHFPMSRNVHKTQGSGTQKH